MIDEIGPRREYWSDHDYYRGLRARHRRVTARYGAGLFMSETIQQEIIKAFEQRVHLCSGLGEELMIEIVQKYFRDHPQRAKLGALLARGRPFRPEDHPKKR